MTVVESEMTKFGKEHFYATRRATCRIRVKKNTERAIADHPGKFRDYLQVLFQSEWGRVKSREDQWEDFVKGTVEGLAERKDREWFWKMLEEVQASQPVGQ